MVELDAALRLRVGERRGVVGDLVVEVEELEDALGRRDAGLQHVDHRRELGERLGELARVLDEGLDVADAHLAGDDAQAADHGDDHVVQVPEEHHHRLHDARDELGPEARLVEVLVLVVEAGPDVVLAAERPDERVAGERLLDLRVEAAGVGPLVDEALLRARGDRLDPEDRDRDREHDDEREQGRDR